MNSHYNDYEEEDFLLDESFRQYCMGRDAVAVKFWKEWAERHPEKKTIIENAKRLYLLLNGQNTSAQYRHHEEIFRERFQQHLEKNKQHRFSKHIRSNAFRNLLLYGTPALLVICIVIVLLTTGNNDRETSHTETNTSKTGNGEHKSFQLPDGTKITLNAGSKLIVSEQFNQKLREITLDGEALLDVAHNRNKPFIIHTPTMDVRVLGTVLNIKAYSTDKKSETSLIKGMVEVTLKDGKHQKIILHPHQKIVVEKDGYQLKTNGAGVAKANGDSAYVIRPLEDSGADSSVNEILWTRAKLVFEDDNFEEIAIILERTYDVTIELSGDVKEFRYTGTFDSKNIEEVLNALQLSRYFEYTISQNKKITIAAKRTDQIN